MRNIDIVNMWQVTIEMRDRKMAGLAKFKWFSMAQKLNDLADPIVKALLETTEGSDEWNEIANFEQEIDLPKFSQEDFLNVEMSLEEMAILKTVIDFEGGM